MISMAAQNMDHRKITATLPPLNCIFLGTSYSTYLIQTNAKF